jgi:hypothetical protein
LLQFFTIRRIRETFDLHSCVIITALKRATGPYKPQTNNEEDDGFSVTEQAKTFNLLGHHKKAKAAANLRGEQA